MIEYQATLTLAQPIDRVFQFLTTPANYPRWDVMSLSMNALDPGPWQVGMRLRERRRLGGQVMELEARVTAYEPPQRLVIESLGSPQFRGGWELRATGDATLATYMAELDFNGLLRTIEPLIARPFRQQLNTSLNQLRQLLGSLPEA